MAILCIDEIIVLPRQLEKQLAFMSEARQKLMEGAFATGEQNKLKELRLPPSTKDTYVCGSPSSRGFID